MQTGLNIQLCLRVLGYDVSEVRLSHKLDAKSNKHMAMQCYSGLHGTAAARDIEDNNDMFVH